MQEWVDRIFLNRQFGISVYIRIYVIDKGVRIVIFATSKNLVV